LPDPDEGKEGLEADGKPKLFSAPDPKRLFLPGACSNSQITLAR